MLFIFVLQIWVFASFEELKETQLFYGDRDQNGKIDTLELHFNVPLEGSLNFEKLFLYSNTWWLSSSLLDGVSGGNIFSSATISGNILQISLVEQDLFSTNLIINATPSSHLRLKTNAWVGIKDAFWKEIKLLYGSSFSSYRDVFQKDFSQNIPENEEVLPQDPLNIEEEEEVEENEQENLSGTWGENLSENIVETEDQEENFQEDENSSSGELLQSGSIFPDWDIKFAFQSPSYLLEKDVEQDFYTCDSSQTDCKVNFQILLSSSWSEWKSPSTNYVCEWDFWDSQFDEEKNKCNPNTITFPVGEFLVKYRVSQKNAPENFKFKEFRIINTGYVPPLPKVVYVSGGWGSSFSAQNSNIFIETPRIEVQSWLDENNTCSKNDCQVNLIYEPKNSDERCLWDFSWGLFKDSLLSKCNPWYVSYPLWSYVIKLKVYQYKNEGNYKESTLLFVNKKQEISPNIPLESTQSETELSPKITLQGVLWEKKYMEWKHIFCLSSSCSLNFDARDSVVSNPQKTQYIWNFWNGETFTWANPPSYVFATGKYEVFLSILDEDETELKDHVFIEVWIPQKKEFTQEEKENMQQKYPLSFVWIFPNPKGEDREEFIEIFSSGSQEISLEKCYMELWENKKKIPFEKNHLISPNVNKKFYQFDLNFTLKNSWKNSLSLFCEDVMLDTLEWNFKVPDDFFIEKTFFPELIQEVKKEKKSEKYKISYTDGSEKIVNFTLQKTLFTDFIQELSHLEKTSDDPEVFQDLKKQKIEKFMNATFYQKISKQKSWVKIFGNTFPNTRMLISLEEQEDEFVFDFFFPKTYAQTTYEVISDTFWSYELFLQKPPKGNFLVKTELQAGKNISLPLEKTQTLEIDSEYLAYISDQKQESIFPLFAYITVQGKSTKTKTLSAHTLRCQDVSECSVNFDGRKSTGKNITYFWDFWNGKTFTKSNPASYKFWEGKHVISLQVSDGKNSHISYYVVEVIPKPAKKTSQDIPLKTLDSQKISSSKSDYKVPEKFPLKYHFIYSLLIFLLFCLLSVVILRQRNIV